MNAKVFPDHVSNVRCVWRLQVIAQIRLLTNDLATMHRDLPCLVEMKGVVHK